MFPNTQAPTLNAIPPRHLSLPQADERAENLAACLELRDIGMRLARAAASRALEAHENPPPPPEPDTPTQKSPDPDLAFARHARSVRQSVELWERITANAFARPTGGRYTPEAEEPEYDLDEIAQPSPRFCLIRANLVEAAVKLTLTHPDREQLHETIPDIVEDTLDAFPEDHPSTHFDRICQALGVPPDRTRLEPHLESQLRPPIPPH